jgi:hypothetical protein
MNKTEISRELGLSANTVRRHLAKRGAPQPTADGGYNLGAVRRFIEREQARDNRYADGDLQTARLRKVELECKMLRERLRLNVAQVPVDAVEGHLWAFLNLLNGVYRSAIDQHAGRFVRLESPATARAALIDLNASVQNHLTAAMKSTPFVAGRAVVPWPIPHPSWHTPRPGEQPDYDAEPGVGGEGASDH